MRYHLHVGYSYLNGWSGLDIQPATLGFPLQAVSKPDVGFAIEPFVDLLGVELYFGGDGVSFLVESGAGVQGVVSFERTFLALLPLSLQLRVIAAGEVIRDAPGLGLGLNLPLRASGGLRF